MTTAPDPPQDADAPSPDVHAPAEDVRAEANPAPQITSSWRYWPVAKWVYRRRRALTFVAIICVSLAYVLLAAAYQASRSILSFDNYLVPRSIDIFVFGWSAWVGASIGSFLNVVAYRVPRGLSVEGRSHCPRCRQKLLARDNLPVFGWIFLGGRCRTCRLPISPRYPIVEAAVGLSVATVTFARIYGWSLPHSGNRVIPFSFGMPRFDEPGQSSLLFFHGLAVAALWMLALIRFDGQRLPFRLTAITLLLGTLAIPIWPNLGVVPWNQWEESGIFRNDTNRIDAGLRVLVAWIASALVARSLARSVCPMADLKLDPLGKSTRRLVDLVCLLAIPMLILGWQAGLACAVIATILAAILSRWFPSHFQDPLSSLSIGLAIAFPVHLMIWKAVHAWSFWPSDVSPPMTILVWGFVLLISPTWLRSRSTTAT